MDKIYARVPQSTNQVHNSRNILHKETNSLLFKSIQFEKDRLERISSKRFNKKNNYRRIIAEKNNLTYKVNKTVKEMTPSFSTKTIMYKQAETEIDNYIKQYMADKNNFDLVPELFFKVIRADEKYGWILKEIKNAYEGKLTDLSQKCIEYEGKIVELNKKVQEINELSRKLASAHYKTNSAKLSDLTLSPKKTIGKSSNDKELGLKKGIIIPRLDLSKVHNIYERDKVVYVSAKPGLKNLSTADSIKKQYLQS